MSVSTNPILQDLTAPQREAVTHIDGPMLVVAGAGSGKTRVVTRRIAYLIEQGISPHNILAMTFTNKAAGEMKERVEDLVGHAPRYIGTFHSACARFLRFDLDKLGEGRSGDFSIYDDADQKGLVKQILKDLEIDDKRFKPANLLGKISRAKCDMIGPDDYRSESWDDDITVKVYRRYEKTLRQMNACDFDDLLLLTVQMLKHVQKLRDQYQERFRYILIDEYQDTNRTQYNLMRLLVGPNQNIHVTGDPDQSIYSWRGAEYRNIMDFQNHFPETRLVRLEQNYRSTKCILSAANALIQNNKERIDKDLFTENEEGETITVATLPDDRFEARFVCDMVQDERNKGKDLSDMAVFYRTNAQSRSFEEALMSAAIPYQIVGGVRFYQRKEIKDFLAHLKLMVNQRDTVSLERILGARSTGVGAKTLAAIRAQAEAQNQGAFEFLCREDFRAVYQGRMGAKLKDFAGWCRRLSQVPQKPVGQCVKDVLELSGLILAIETKADRDPATEDRLENLQAFVNRAVEFEDANPDAALPQFLEEVALVADIDSWEESNDTLSLMTLHSAKGLEFPVVFLVGLEHGLLPHSNSIESRSEEEERRLFYVGLTRAQKKAYVSHAQSRMLWGQVSVTSPSPYLHELPTDCCEHIGLAGHGAEPFSSSGGRPGGRRGGESRDWDDLDDFDLGDDFDPGVDPDDPFPDDDFHDPFAGTPTLRTGDHVEHPTFGRGKILSLSNKQAVIQFFVGGTRKLHLDVAQIRKV